jgi:hypothetical protein
MLPRQLNRQLKGRFGHISFIPDARPTLNFKFLEGLVRLRGRDSPLEYLLCDDKGALGPV